MVAYHYYYYYITIMYMCPIPKFVGGGGTFDIASPIFKIVGGDMSPPPVPPGFTHMNIKKYTF